MRGGGRENEIPTMRELESERVKRKPCKDWEGKERNRKEKHT